MKASILLAPVPVSDSITNNIEMILAGLDHAQEGDIVVFPEGMVSGYAIDLSFLKEMRSEQLEAALEELRGQAQARKIYLWVGSYIKDGLQWFNAAFGFTPNGGAHQYRKINLARHERRNISPGSSLPVFEQEIAGGTLTLGVQICREIHFPEQWGWLAREGAQVILHLNNTINDTQLQAVWRSHLVSHAAANQRFVISVNHASVKQNCPTMAISPEGLVLEEILSDRPIFKRVEIDLEQISDYYIEQCRQDIVMITVPENKARRRILRSMKLNKLQDDLDELQNNPALYEESNLSARTEALEFIRLLEEMYTLRPRDHHLEMLYRQGMELRGRLEQINNNVFAKLRGRLKMGEITINQLREIFYQFTDYHKDNPGQAHYGYEDLDGLISGVFLTKPLPEEILERKPGMIHYQSTPASVILELVDRVNFSAKDVFYDLGSGLGLVVGLVHILTGAHCIGVEYQPSYSKYAHQIAREFGFTQVAYINSDAQEVDLSDGSVFYLFNPFGGHIFDAVMANIHVLAGKKDITVCSYGPCTEQIAKLTWLEIEDPGMVHDFKLAIFHNK